MSDIRKSLESLADSIEKIQNKPAPRANLKYRELSGDHIHGGKITKFASTGIVDESADTVLTVKNDGIHVDTVYAREIGNSLQVTGDINVVGEITAKKMHVHEISADIRNERTSPLEFKGEGKPAFGKGILWTGGKYTKQLILQSNPDRLWSSEDIDLHRDKTFSIGGQTVITSTSLGDTVTSSNLKKIGTLSSLKVNGNVDIDSFVRYNADTEQFSIGAEDPAGMFSIQSLDHQFLIDTTADKNWKIGTWTTSGLDIVTDDTVRIEIQNNGKIKVCSKTVFDQSVGIGVNNFEDDVDLTVGGPVRIQNRKQDSNDNYPSSGNYRKGDIVWNTDPKPTGYVGWICVKSGQPGDWKPFGQISS